MQTCNDINTEILKIFVKTTARIIFNTSNNFNLRNLSLSALVELKRIVNQYIEEFHYNDLIISVFEKKADFIIRAKTKQQLKDILKLSVPEFNGNKYCYYKKYHVEEEELLLWSLESLKYPLGHEEYNRYMELFLKFYPHHKDIFSNN